MITIKDDDGHPRWRPGERLNHIFEQRTKILDTENKSTQLAIDCDQYKLTYRELNDLADILALNLQTWGLAPGDRVGLLFDKTPETYVALLGSLKTGATFVPLDTSFPVERIRYIAEDAHISLFLTMRCFADRFEGLTVPVRFLDEPGGAQADGGRLPRPEPVPDCTAYIIYTSGTTGKPKGVAVAHSSICNFVRVAANVYGYTVEDRVYQGLTLAFDFSFEEILVPLAVGATLVPGRPAGNLVGRDLQEFLAARRVTALCCVPTLLATLDDGLPDLRLLLLSGEACPADLVQRWHRPGRTILNAYGPTETTVTASITRLMPDRKVTIGVPLPSYTMLILDEKETVEKPDGEIGEIAIAGIGVAEGYVGRPELTAAKFVPDILNLPDNPSGRIYRSGDLGRITPEGEIEYLGRIDTQVKIRGYRIELGEIESALMEVPQIAQAVVNSWSPELGVTELVAYMTRRPDAPPLDLPALRQQLGRRLPRYMLPSFIEELETIPLLPSQKADRKALPPPSGPRLSASEKAFVPPSSELERLFADTLQGTLGCEAVSIDAHFFDELGGHSLLMARFCAEVRRTSPERAPSMRDIYLHPTVRQLAGALETPTADPPPTAIPARFHIPSARQYWMCGALQLLYYLLSSLAGVLIAIESLVWLFADDDPVNLYVRATILGAGMLLFFLLLPVALKWMLVGRFRRGEIEIWSLRYFRFWVVKHQIQHSPAALFKGTPIFNLYLAALGAKVSFSAHLDPQVIPVATDLISVGPGSVLRYDALCLGYKAEGNVIRTGPVTIGRDAHVGIASVVDIDTVIGDGAELAPSSSLREGQRLEAGRRYHGTPAVETDASYVLDERLPCSNLRRALYALAQLLGIIFVVTPLMALIFWAIIDSFDLKEMHLALEWQELTAEPLDHVGLALAVSAALYTILLVSGLIFVMILPRIYILFIRIGRTYPLYGLAYGLLRATQGSSNSAFYNLLFGDSSFIVHYLRAIGYRMNRIEQTGSNFGVVHRQDAPTLCDVGSGTMVADGLYMSNVEMSGSAFRLGKARIGERNFFGNNIAYPSIARTGANCFFATKVLIPVTVEPRENIGLLGSPSFEIPRVVSRDAAISEALDERTRSEGLARKTRSNLNTIGWLLLTQWLYFTLLLAVAYFFYRMHSVGDAIVGIAIAALFALFTFGYFLLIERASLGFGRIKPTLSSIYDPAFWRVERYWKLSTSPLVNACKGTPFRNLISRARGARVGRMVFDDGCTMTEMTLTSVGDYCSLNEGTTIQGHSLEEGVFKADHVALGKGCTIGPGAFVHYGVQMGDRSRLDINAFLMKGEAPEEASLWIGNPARAI